MENQLKTQDKLLLQARRQFWARGYSNVSVRQIASAAGVDVALISRHFGSKLGLFQATLQGAFALGDAIPKDAEAMVEMFVLLFKATPRGGEAPSSMLMLLTNAHDDAVGGLVCGAFQDEFHRHIVAITKSETQAALFFAVLLGISVAEKTLHLQGIGAPSSKLYEAQLRHMMTAALTFQHGDMT